MRQQLLLCGCETTRHLKNQLHTASVAGKTSPSVVLYYATHVFEYTLGLGTRGFCRVDFPQGAIISRLSTVNTDTPSVALMFRADVRALKKVSLSCSLSSTQSYSRGQNSRTGCASDSGAPELCFAGSGSFAVGPATVVVLIAFALAFRCLPLLLCSLSRFSWFSIILTL